MCCGGGGRSAGDKGGGRAGGGSKKEQGGGAGGGFWGGGGGAQFWGPAPRRNGRGRPCPGEGRQERNHLQNSVLSGVMAWVHMHTETQLVGQADQVSAATERPSRDRVGQEWLASIM